MIKNVVREFNWPPHIIGGLFIDDLDYESLEFWNNDVEKTHQEIKRGQKKK